MVRTGPNKKTRWIKSIQRYSNTHDVHAMAVIKSFNKGKRLISVGIDANLLVDDPNRKTIQSYPPFAWGNNAVLAPDVKVLGLRYDNAIQLWKLGEGHPPPPGSVQDAANHTKTNQRHVYLANKPLDVLSIKTEPVKLIEIQCKDDDTTQNFHMSPNAKWLGYCTKDKLRLYKTDLGDPGKPKLIRLKLHNPPDRMEEDDYGGENSQNRVPHILRFTCADTMIAASRRGDFTLYSLSSDSDKAVVLWNHQADGDVLKLDHGIASIEVDPVKGHFCVISDHKSNVVVYDLQDERLQCRLPMYQDSPLTCLAIHPR